MNHTKISTIMCTSHTVASSYPWTALNRYAICKIAGKSINFIKRAGMLIKLCMCDSIFDHSVEVISKNFNKIDKTVAEMTTRTIKITKSEFIPPLDAMPSKA